MRHNKKPLFLIISILVIMILSFTLIACKDNDNDNDSKEPSDVILTESEALSALSLAKISPEAFHMDCVIKDRANLTIDSKTENDIPQIAMKVDAGLDESVGVVYYAPKNSFIEYREAKDSTSYKTLTNAEAKLESASILNSISDNKITMSDGILDLIKDNKKDDAIIGADAKHAVTGIKKVNGSYSVKAETTLVDRQANFNYPLLMTFKYEMDSAMNFTSISMTTKVLDGYLPPNAESPIVLQLSINIKYEDVSVYTPDLSKANFTDKGTEPVELYLDGYVDGVNFDGKNDCGMMVNPGDKVTLPKPVHSTLKDSDFAGYYYDSEFLCPVKDNIYEVSYTDSYPSVYAKWNSIGTPTINLNGGEWVGEAPTNMVLASEIYNYKATHKDYKRYAWYLDEACTQELQFYDSATIVTNDTKLYAKWSDPKSDYHKVTITPTMDLAYKAIPQVIEVKNNKPIGRGRLPRFVIEGYANVSEEGYSTRYPALYTDKECTKLFDQDSPITEDKTLYVKFVEGYKVSLVYFEGAVTDIANPKWRMAEKNKPAYLPDAKIYPPSKYFECWCKDPAGENALAIGDTPITADVTFYARYIVGSEYYE